jgi:hypothetical protein
MVFIRWKIEDRMRIGDKSVFRLRDRMFNGAQTLSGSKQDRMPDR